MIILKLILQKQRQRILLVESHGIVGPHYRKKKRSFIPAGCHTDTRQSPNITDQILRVFRLHKLITVFLTDMYAVFHLLVCHHKVSSFSRSQWPRGLRRRSAAARLLRLWVRFPPATWMFVCCGCFVLSGRGLCDGLITRPEESYRLWCVAVCDPEKTSRMRRP